MTGAVSSIGAIAADLLAGARLTELQILLLSVVIAGPAGALLSLLTRGLRESGGELSA